MADEVQVRDGVAAAGRPASPPPGLPAGGERSRAPGDLRWLLGVWALVAVFAAVTAVWSQHVGVPLRDPGGRMFRTRLTSALVFLAVLAVLESAWRARRTTGRVRDTWRVLRARWTGQRVLLAVSGLLAYHVVYICYRNLKSWDVFNTVRDTRLLAVDRWLLAGHSPAVLLHDLLGQDHAAYVLMFAYKSFTYLVPLSVVGSLVLVDRIRDAYVFVTAGMWVWVLGVGSYYLVPSLGPFASAPEEFAGLPHTAITDTQAQYLDQRAQLLAHPAAGDAFASISAFASLHVGFTCMVVLMLRYYGFRRAAHVLTGYLAVVVVATVYFGWHFVVDDVAGVLLAAAAVALARLVVRPGADHES